MKEIDIIDRLVYENIKAKKNGKVNHLINMALSFYSRQQKKESLMRLSRLGWIVVPKRNIKSFKSYKLLGD